MLSCKVTLPKDILISETILTYVHIILHNPLTWIIAPPLELLVLKYYISSFVYLQIICDKMQLNEQNNSSSEAGPNIKESPRK